MFTMPEKDKQNVQNRYARRYHTFGYSPKTLGWDKGKQDLRYKILFEEFSLEGKSILDIGCGFGDANKTLLTHTNNYTYLGIDIVEELITEAKKRYASHKNINFILDDFLHAQFDNEYDIVVASGVFNFKLQDMDNYDFIYKFMQKAFTLSKEGIAFDFLSDKVDYTYDHTFHSDPSKILEMGYRFSRNLILKNHYMPFEFALVLFKDQSFLTSDTVFKRYKHEK